MDDQNTKTPTNLRVKITSPAGTLLEEEANSLSAINVTGPFDILPGHRSFITLLVPCVISVQTTRGGAKEIEVNSGVLHVEKNFVQVFLNIL